MPSLILNVPKKCMREGCDKRVDVIQFEQTLITYDNQGEHRAYCQEHGDRFMELVKIVQGVARND